MSVSWTVPLLHFLCVAAGSTMELASGSARCERSPKILQARQGEIRSSAHHSWSSRQLNCSWLIPAPMGEPVILSFSQFFTRCGVEWVSVTSSEGAPTSLCGSQLPRPMELRGGNITVTHHFVQHIYPLSMFRLSYIRGSTPCAVGEFPCAGGRCLPASWRCNGQTECLGEAGGGGAGTTAGGRDSETKAHRDSGSCGGLLKGFYGWFSPPALAGPPLLCVWTVDPQDPRPLRLDLRLLELGPGDTLTITDQPQGQGHTIKTITCASNYKVVEVESRTGLLSLTYRMLPGSEGRGFNATASSPLEVAAQGRGGGRFLGHPVCFRPKDRCNYQLYCADGSDEKDCTVCQPGTFHCDSDRCVFESWRCDGQVDCKDGTDELNCTVTLPRKVITAATLGSLVCGLLLVIAMGCTCKLYSLRTREYSMFAPISRQEAELIQQQAPPSYGQLIAQGAIPPVEDFPTENPNESSTLSLRGILQLLRHDPGSSSRRRRRPRFVRRTIRRMRRWGLLPRAAPRPSQSSSPSPQQAGTAPTGSEPNQSSAGGSSLAGEGASSPLPQKLALHPQTEPAAPPASLPGPPLPTTPPPRPCRPPPPPPAPPLPRPAAPPLGSPWLASVFHSLGLSISLFRPAPPPCPSPRPPPPPLPQRARSC
ncbi:hypothetical protein MATL_G00199430 [Megalops atlanticus]|uniref:CUB domain-containing protein n=1 Tax=Megalops atlanticus TaxID=7932 RepID=A0A9D3SYW2_MEGAT|nr:hypothetical protein MATL_G00199430 [Megalops atlanticus]